MLSQGVLLVSGVRDDGLREILAVEIADTESEATYQEMFRSLKGRRLSGVEVVVSDDHGGLKAAIARHFQGVAYQRCQVHYARNLLGMVGHARRKELSEGLRGVLAATGREWLCISLPSWRPGGVRATPGSLNISKSTSRNALPA